MRPNNYLTREKRTEYLKEKTEKEKQADDNDENEEEEDDEEDEEKNKDNAQKSRPFQSSRPVINKDVKSTIISRDERSKLTNQNSQTFNRQRIIYTRNQDNSNLREGSNIRGGEQEKNQTITPASRIIAKTNYTLRTNQNQPYNLRLNQNSSRGQLNTQISQSSSNTQLRSQNSQTQIRSQLPTKTETQQTQAPQYNRYTRRVIESTVHKEDNNKEIKIINRNNNYTINVTNNNNTINVTNNNDVNANRDKNEKEQEEEKEKEEVEPKREIRKEPRIDYRREPRIQEREREVINKKENDNYNNNNNKKEEENKINESDVVVKEKYNNTSQIENKKENEIGSQLTDRRKEYVTNDTMIKNGVEIVEFTPEETQRVLEKKAENGEIKKRKKEKKLFKKKKQKKAKINNNNDNNDTNIYFEKNTYNAHKPYETFYKRGKDNFSKRIIRDREFYSKRNNFGDYDRSFDYDDSFEDYNNKTISGLDSYNDNRRGYMKRYDRYDNDTLRNRRINNFYDRGRPNPIRGFRGRRGGRY